jgi:hypothetical protein
MKTPSLRPTLRVIEGGGNPTPKLFDLPTAVLTRSPFSRDAIVGFRLATEDARKALDNNRRQPIYDLWSAVLGHVPPQTGASLDLPDGSIASLSGVATAYACFRGIRRPAGDDTAGYDFFAYVHKAEYTFKFEPSMSRCVKLVRVPDDLVFVTHMKLDYPEGRPYGKNAFKDAAVKGVITHWGFVEADPRNPMMPINHETRFRRRVW